HLFVSGARAPQFYNPEQIDTDYLQFNPDPKIPGHELPEPLFLELMGILNFATSTALYDDEEMRRVMLPSVRADVALNNTYTAPPRPPLDIPITVMGGRVDPFVSGVQLVGWREQTRAALDR